MKAWNNTSFELLLIDSKDGEWGQGEPSSGFREALIIRGTDFPDLNKPGAEFPRRWVKDHIVERKQLRPHDLILETAGGTSTQSTGRTALLTASFFREHKKLPVLCASFSRHLRLDTQNYSPHFIYYLLQALYRTGYMGVFNIQHTGVSRFQYTAFKNHTQLQIPALVTQRKIAAVLSAYDELIENNNRRIALLGKLAEEIYREWFARLRFPGHDKVKRVKGVSEAWRRSRIGDLTSFLKRGAAPIYDEQADGIVINQKCIRGGQVDLQFARRQSRDVHRDRHVRIGDVLVNSTGEGTLGRVGQVQREIPNCIVDTHITIVRPKPGIPVHYFGMTLKSWEVHLGTMGRGSTNQTELAPSVIGGIEIVLPSEKITSAFEAHAGAVFQQITILEAQNTILEKSRDALLPRLIAGRVSVENLDVQFPPGMTEELKNEPVSDA